jgi:type I site-specific restriction endonuclease
MPNAMKELITDIKDLPINLQKAITDGIKNQIEAQILVQKELNPDGLNDYLNAELESATKAMQTMIQESQRDGAIIETISEIYVWNKERAKKIQEYRNTQNTHPNKEPFALPKELDNTRFKSILKKAVKAGFVKKTDEGYKWNGQKNELALFAQKVSNVLHLSNKQNERGEYFVNWLPFVELFGVKRAKLITALNDIKSKGKNPKREKNIELLFS